MPVIESSTAQGLERIVFLIPPTGSWCREDRCQSRFRLELIPSMRAPLEECEAAGAVLASGGEAWVIDAPAEGLAKADVLRRIRAIGPDLIVLSVTFGSLEDDLAWTGPLRRTVPGTQIAVRGAPAYSQAEAILANAPHVDFCVRGDYEIVFAALVAEGGPGPGSLFRTASGVKTNGSPPITYDLDALPRPAREVVDPTRYRVRGLRAPQATVRVQRGCPFPCSYCLVHTVSGNRARHRSPESVADEVAELSDRGIDYLYLRADTFSVDREWAIATSDAIGRAAPRARWVTTTRVDCVDDRVIAAMARGGCYGISFGIDVGSQEIGRKVGKRPDLERAERAMRVCDRHRVLSLGYFMLGFAWETRESLRETSRFMRAVRPDLLTIHFAHPYPGTRYSDDVAAMGLEVASKQAQAEPAFDAPGLSSGELQSAARSMILRHYSDPRVLQSVLRKGLRCAAEATSKRLQRACRTGRGRQPGHARPATSRPTPAPGRRESGSDRASVAVEAFETP